MSPNSARWARPRCPSPHELPGWVQTYAVRRITLPPAKATAADLLKEVKSGAFGRGVDWTSVKRAVAGRRRSRDLRSA
jgi:hypothetical protein